MPLLPLPGLDEVVICGMTTWALTALIANTHVGAPIRDLGQRALRWKGLPWLLAAPFRAAALCMFCLSWWTAGAVAALACAYTASPWYAVLLPTGVALNLIIEKIVAARPQSKDSTDALFKKLQDPTPPPPPPPFRL